MTDKSETEIDIVAKGERVAKWIARAGICSRRDAEKLIAEGRVAVDGRKIDSPALALADPARIAVDGKTLPPIEPTRLWRYHKSPGCVTTARDPQGRPTVFEKLPPEMPRVISIGRLDLNSEGLLLLTNDGELARKLELPANGWRRVYRVRAHGAVDEARLDGLKDGIEIDGVRYGAIEVSIDNQSGANTWFTITLTEGKNREIRKVLEHLGLSVNRLIRLQYGPFKLGDLTRGAVAEVPGPEMRKSSGLLPKDRTGWAKAKPKPHKPGNAGARRYRAEAEAAEAEKQAKPETGIRQKPERTTKPDTPAKPRADRQTKPDVSTRQKPERTTKPEAQAKPRADRQTKPDVSTRQKPERTTKPEAQAKPRADKPAKPGKPEAGAKPKAPGSARPMPGREGRGGAHRRGKA